MRFPNYYLKLFKEIHANLYKKFDDNQIHCFLCGSNDMSFRNTLKEKLENKNIKVIYAENLFEAIVHSKSNINHLDLEQALAIDVELILIVLESPGALVELGMFSNDDEHIKKLMVLMDETYKKDESFINYGPIKKLKDHKELKDIKRVFYYKLEKEKKLNTYQDRELNKSLKEYNLKYSNVEEKQILNIISLYYFLKIILFIYNPIDVDELNNLLKYLCTEKEIEFTEEEINIKVESIMHWLQKEKYIKKIEEKRYELTREGILEIQTELYGIFGTKVIDNYRVQALNYQLRIKDKIS